MLNPAGREYNTVMLPMEAAPGEEVVLSGPTFRGEDGRFFPADRLGLARQPSRWESQS